MVFGVSFGLNPGFTTCHCWAWVCYLIFLICTEKMVIVVKRIKCKILSTWPATPCSEGAVDVTRSVRSLWKWHPWRDGTGTPELLPWSPLLWRRCHYYSTQTSVQLGVHARLRHQQEVFLSAQAVYSKLKFMAPALLERTHLPEQTWVWRISSDPQKEEPHAFFKHHFFFPSSTRHSMNIVGIQWIFMEGGDEGAESRELCGYSCVKLSLTVPPSTLEGVELLISGYWLGS